MAIIALTQGKITVVDDEDYARLSRHKWHYTQNGYAATRVGNKIYYMQQLILPEVPPSMMRDHIDRDKLNNRKSNLRIATRQENALNVNRRKYQGISYDATHDRFKCYYDKITLGQPKQRVNIGTFRTRDAAYAARQQYLKGLTKCQ